ncbi:MAG: SDR family oxidoreductase [Acidimicrobiales bacterium]|nr:SDR family oxidoreductase [Acidimicrobiales bacterium]
MGLSGTPSPWDTAPPAPHDILLTDRVAVVTGAARGIGKATALALARFGAHVAVCDRLADELAETVTELEALGRTVVSSVFDVRVEADVEAFMGEVGERFERLDILVNNAGGGFVANFLDVSAKGEAALVSENFGTVTNCVRHGVPLMTAGGSIINITSIEAHRAGPGFAIYSAMKAAVANLSMSLSMELAERRIRVNCLACDMIPTPGDDTLGSDSDALALPGLRSQTWPVMGSPDDCAATVVFLASELSQFVTGSTIHVDGGNWAAAGWKTASSGVEFRL